MPFRITTWNVNGIRNPFGYQPWREKRTFEAMFDILEADIVIMQELKIQRKDLRDDMVLVSGWDCYFSLPKHKKGYSGVGIYTRQAKCAPIRAEEGVLGVLCPPHSDKPYCELPEDKHIGGYPTLLQQSILGVDAAALDSEGRCVVLEFPAFVLFGIYSPANSSGTRDDFRYGFLNALDMRIRNLIRMGKNVVVTGDLNVSRSEMDTANAEEMIRKEGMSHQDYISTPNRRIFNQLLEGGEVAGERDEGREEPVMWDVCRGFHERRKGMFTHWEQKINARPGNFGSRIDFILCGLAMKSWFQESNIQEGLMGSDHCPVYAIMSDEADISSVQTHLPDILNPVGMFQNGIRQRDHTVKDICAFSARLLPEFDKRQSIKSMFSRKPSLKQEDSSASPIVPPDDVHHPEAPTGDADCTLNLQSEDSGTPNGTQAPTQSQGTVSTVTVASTPTSPVRKRPSSEAAVARPTKKIKSSSNATSTTPAKGQSSLKGFFAAKPVTSTAQAGIAKDTLDSDTVVSSMTGKYRTPIQLASHLDL
ncbi:MAG: Class II abasic (AP) endonuclease [Chrysothrix sp. TS-e1954]|nr:MAG: Class II abasic (AP) endonuclease [Chrysothrix sp. TS-e1954]